MRKVALVTMAILLVATFCFAQVPRTASNVAVSSWYTGDESSDTNDYNHKTNFTNIAVTGLDVDYNPGYIEFVTTNGSGSVVSYFMWVDMDGTLMLASDIAIANSGTNYTRANSTANTIASSFPTGSWRALGTTTGTAVGSQS